jgi:chromodomain-helicase-DNA-binding protein 4
MCNRNLVQMVSVEEDDLAGLEDVSSDGEDDNYEAELTDSETTITGAPPVRKPYKKKARGIFSLSYCSIS